MQSQAQKINEFKGLMKIAHSVLEKYEEARVNKNALVFLMWRESGGGNSIQFTTDFINGAFKVESYTRAARKVVELLPHLGNPNRKRLEKQMKITIKECSSNPNQIEINFGGLK